MSRARATAGLLSIVIARQAAAQATSLAELPRFFLEAGVGFGGHGWDGGGGPGLHGRIAPGVRVAGPIAISLELYGSRDWADPESELLAGPMVTASGALLLHVEFPLSGKWRSPGARNEVWGIASGLGAVYLWRRVTDGPNQGQFHETGWVWPMRWYICGQPPRWPFSLQLFVEFALLVFDSRPVARPLFGVGVRW